MTIAIIMLTVAVCVLEWQHYALTSELWETKEKLEADLWEIIKDLDARIEQLEKKR